MAAKFSFELDAGSGQSPSIWEGGVENTSCVVNDNADGTYYVTGLSSGVYSVKVSGAYVNGLIDQPFADATLLAHVKTSNPHPLYVYSETEVDSLFTTHETSADHDGRYYTETEIDANFAPGDEDGIVHPILTVEPTANAANDGREYYLLSGNATVGQTDLKMITRTNYTGTAHVAVVVKALDAWDFT